MATLASEALRDSRRFRLRSVWLNLSVVSGAAVLALVLAALIFGPALLQVDPLVQNLDARLQPPAWLPGGTSEHLLGRDALGRDMLVRLLYGGRISVLLAGGTVASAGLLGFLLGLVSGYFGGLPDDALMRIAEIQMAFPFIVLALILMAVFGAGAFPMAIAFTVSGWPVFAKITRGVALSVREKEFIEAAHAIGCTNMHVVRRHVLPNVLPYVVILAPLQFTGMILTEAGLSFVGIGIQPPTASWGNMLGEGRAYLSNAWWLATFPGVALMITVLGANLLSDGLQAMLSPRRRLRGA